METTGSRREVVITVIPDGARSKRPADLHFTARAEVARLIEELYRVLPELPDDGTVITIAAEAGTIFGRCPDCGESSLCCQCGGDDPTDSMIDEPEPDPADALFLPGCALCGRPAASHGVDSRDDAECGCHAWRSAPGMAMDAAAAPAVNVDAQVEADRAAYFRAASEACGATIYGPGSETSCIRPDGHPGDCSDEPAPAAGDGAGWPAGMRPPVLAPAGDDDVICATPGCGHRERHHFGKLILSDKRPCPNCACPDFTAPAATVAVQDSGATR